MNSGRRILGVDPGSLKTGVGLIDVRGSRLIHVHHEVIRPPAGELAARLFALFARLQEIIRKFRPDAAAMEDVFLARNAASALKLGQARGALLTACAGLGLAVTPYSPALVKQAVVGTGRADKAQVKHMVQLLLKPPGTLAEDAADALAVAICHAHHTPMRLQEERP